MPPDSQPAADPVSQLWRTEVYKLLKAAGLKGRQAVYLTELSGEMMDAKIALNNGNIESIGNQLIIQQSAFESTVRTEMSALREEVVAKQDALAANLVAKQDALAANLVAKQDALAARQEAMVTKQDAQKESTDMQIRNLRWLMIAAMGAGTLAVTLLGVLVTFSDRLFLGL